MPEKYTVRQPPADIEITCKSKLFELGAWTILRLPEEASAKLPARGQVMAKGSLNDVPFNTPLEPDGKLSHWFKIDKSLLEKAKVQAGDIVSLKITPTKVWPEPEISEDLRKAIEADLKIHAVWQRITPMARWEWVRWIRNTSDAATREHRIEIACSKMRAGKRRPCCWNRNLCTEPSVSKNGVLLVPEPTPRT